MYAITGITGRVGGAAANALLANGHSVRAIVRNPAKGEAWVNRGAEVAVADVLDAAALTKAFTNVDGVFLMVPPYFAPAAGYPETRAIVATLREALLAAAPPKIVALSSVGAGRTHGLGLITQSHILEESLSDLNIPIAFIRAAWFMENSSWDIETARETGVLSSFLHPLDRAIPMVATADIGQAAADTLQQAWTGRRIIEIEGPRRYSQTDIAAVLETLTGRPVKPIEVPRDQWAATFEAQGTAADRTAPRIEMLDGFNSGWIDFGDADAEHLVGSTTMEEALGAK